MKKIIAVVIILLTLNILILNCISIQSNYESIKNRKIESDNFVSNISFIDNNPPIIRDPNPENNTIASISLAKLSLFIEDFEGDNIDWTIETSPDIGSNYGFGETNGTKTCDINGLDYSTSYKWYVNATDPFGSNIHSKKVYIFTIEDASAYIPTVAKIEVVVLPRNSLAVNPIGFSDEISEWTDYENKVRVEWELKNPQHLSYGKPNLVYRFRIREYQIYNKWAPIIFLFTESGRIDTPQGDWIDVVIPVRSESYNDSTLIDVNLLELNDMVMVSGFYCFDTNVQGLFLFDSSTHRIYFNDI